MTTHFRNALFVITAVVAHVRVHREVLKMMVLRTTFIVKLLDLQNIYTGTIIKKEIVSDKIQHTIKRH